LVKTTKDKNSNLAKILSESENDSECQNDINVLKKSKSLDD
jgi:hypothetical protein